MRRPGHRLDGDELASVRVPGIGAVVGITFARESVRRLGVVVIGGWLVGLWRFGIGFAGGRCACVRGRG